MDKDKYQNYVCDGYTCSNSPNLVRYPNGTVKELGELDKPIFCPGCRNRDTFEQQPKKDVRSAEDDKTLWEAWGCKLCGYTALNYLVRGKECQIKNGS